MTEPMTSRIIDRTQTDRKSWRAYLAYLKYWTILHIASAFSAVSAGMVEQAIITATPVMQVKDGSVQGCGFRLKAFPKSFAEQSSFIALDASFNLYSPGLGIVKGGALRIVVKDGNFQSTNRQTESFWLKVEGEKPTTAADGKVHQSPDSIGYLIYAVSTDAITRLFAGMPTGALITIGVRVKGEPIDRIYSGQVQLSDTDRKQGGQCLADLIKEIESADSGVRSRR
jgi:hypothetical protein